MFEAPDRKKGVPLNKHGLKIRGVINCKAKYLSEDSGVGVVGILSAK